MLLKALYTILSSIVLFGVLFLTDFLIFIDIEETEFCDEFATQ